MAVMLNVEVWSDFVCPFCFLGKRRLERAAAEENLAITVTWRSFELDPMAPREATESTTQMLVRKYGMPEQQAIQSQVSLAAAAAGEGIDFQWQAAKPVNTFDAHRVAHLAADRDLGGEVEERFMRAFMTEGESLGDPASLLRLATSVGLDADEVRGVLESDAYADAVRADQQVAREQLRIQGVPFFVFAGRLAISGAQPGELFRQALRQAAELPALHK
jgi:predicted DsbA family dithiol-disulfide isomerase